MGKGWIGVDLDGSLAVYTRDINGPDRIGEPIPKMLHRVKTWLAQGWDVRIFTARVHPDNCWRETSIKSINDWCMKHLGRTLPITCSKDYMMVCLYDDRAVGLITNTGERADGLEDIADFNYEPPPEPKEIV